MTLDIDMTLKLKYFGMIAIHRHAKKSQSGVFDEHSRIRVVRIIE